MASSTHVTGDTEQIRQAIIAFTQDRFQPKLDKLKDGDDEARRKLLAEHEPQAWIADAARRVSQIQQVTHALKFTHPDAKGSSLSAPGNVQAGEFLIGSHTLADSLPPDIVGNAAALDVYKFLRLEVDGQSLLDRAIAGDPALASALSDDADLAAQWMAAFATLPEPNGQPATHKLAKQLYWPLGEGRYHLLAPLFPTSLAQVVWAGIRKDRFSDEAKAAREAQREKRAHPNGYCEYRNLAIQKFGGTKPQNISQLNSERHGENWLLPSLPPNWQSDPIRSPFFTESVFSRRFGNRRDVKELTRILRDFLRSVAKPDFNNIRIRNKRAELVGYIRDELLQFAAEIHEIDGGWSQDERCRLNAAEQCWLDPKRASGDEAFAARWRRGDWQDEICQRFGNWLNAAISDDKKTPMGQAEAEAWQAVLDDELRMIRLELTDHD
ncbi:MAG: type I-F CRISPR-associated protein Csy1 [Candidatus Competibacteraceae bacterium]|nr:type I-F CRISPR-associated protein Csy1 [Candidatus Competibacteraceae bacterium]MCP5124899.1 type I-F CRISPR-associated protein Csy1 [Gammaproteobacteria bacterium]HRX70993.1 type I-F CRISPR-associated protein Csy1 [Candidatus Competibacteraceae bacterium]